jgi:hypothetical protein
MLSKHTLVWFYKQSFSIQDEDSEEFIDAISIIQKRGYTICLS